MIMNKLGVIEDAWFYIKATGFGMKNLAFRIVLCGMILILGLAVLFISAFAYHYRDVRFITAIENRNFTVALSIDGRDKPLNVFLDGHPTMFYGYDERGLVDCRLLLVPEKHLIHNIYILVISRLGIGLSVAKPEKFEFLGTRILALKPLMDSISDVRDDMKGLDADVSVQRDANMVKYIISWKQNEHSHKIVLSIDSRLHALIEKPEKEQPDFIDDSKLADRVVCRRHVASHDIRSSTTIAESNRGFLRSRLSGNEPANVSQLASDKNQVMDELLNQPQIPSDYGETMMKLYRDRKQDVLTRDFAVQHIGLYAQALNRRGEYDAASAESQKLRLALFDAAGETRTIVAAAAFRALSDMSAFDSRIDAGRLDSLLARCAADPSAAPAARAMAVQLCGERRVKSSRPALESIRSDPSAPENLRRSARHSISLLDKGGSR
jgi:hypothetical protein